MTTEAPAVPAGLSASEAAHRLKADGRNEIARAQRRSLGHIVLEVLREPMFQLLLAAALLYLLLGDVGEALVLLGGASLTVGIAVAQESRAERVLDALRQMSSPRALVIRDGQRLRVPGAEVVRGDVVVIAEGDRVPADARLITAHELQADESLLTGESAAVRKRTAATDVAAQRPGGEDLPFVYAGTLIVHGHGVAEVIATGPRSEIGRIGRSLGDIATEPTRLHQQTRRLVRVLATCGLSLSAIVLLLYGWLRHAWMDGLLAGIALAMSMLPEEFPLVLTVFMVLGAWRLAGKRVLTRRYAVIETLGAATVLCTDKTGTLTQNRMTIAELRIGTRAHRVNAGEALPEDFRDLLEHGVLASEPQPFDPMEQAFHALEQQQPQKPDHRRHWRLARRYGLKPELLAMSHGWHRGEAAPIVSAKGAPEAIADLCHLPPEEMRAVHAAASEMAAAGMRVLGVARAEHSAAEWPASQHDFGFRFLGLVGLADPLRASVPQAMQDCRSAGIRVVMITGDYPATARVIAASAGIDVSGDVVTGAQLAKMSEAQLAEVVAHTNVFARILPEQKLAIVRALKSRGEVVAMTGDGVNDAPSLRAAHIGIAMGGRGTDVAREAASIVLLDDDFGSIVTAIRLGRRIYDNLRKAMEYLLAVHVPIAGMSLLPLALDTPMIFSPLHIAFLELIIDPVCSLVFEAEPEERDLMRRPPRDPKAKLFSAATLAWCLCQGGAVLAFIAAIYLVALQLGLPEADLRALVFAAVVVTNFGLIFVNRSFASSVTEALGRRNVALWIVLAVTALLLATTIYVPPVHDLFHFGVLHFDDVGVALGAGAATLVLLELSKRWWTRRIGARR